MPHIPEILPAEVPLAAKLLNYLTQVAATAIMTGQTDDTLHVRLAEYTHKLLSTGKIVCCVTNNEADVAYLKTLFQQLHRETELIV